jgi:anti-sigma-K factor RskA
MDESNEFHEIRKNVPYKIPAGFFEKVSEKTLLKAKQREQLRKNKIMIWRTVAVAASLAAVFFLGYFIPDHDIKLKSNPIVIDNTSVEQQIIQNREITEQITVTEIGKTDPEKVSEKKNAEETDAEEIDDVLAELSDEELMQLVTMFKTDPFISESAQ